MHPEKKGQTSRRIANSRLLTFSCFDFFIMIWVAVRIASNKLKSRKGEEECEEEENRKCNCIIENLEKRVGNKNSFLVISLFLGGLGIDRFVLGQTVLGLLKLFTLGGCGVWWFIDLFLIMGATKDINAESAYRIYCQLRDWK